MLIPFSFLSAFGSEFEAVQAMLLAISVADEIEFEYGKAPSELSAIEIREIFGITLQ